MASSWFGRVAGRWAVYARAGRACGSACITRRLSADLYSGVVRGEPRAGRAARSASRAGESTLSAIHPGQFSDGYRDRGESGGIALGGRPDQARRENARPLPPPGSPNVLLIVMDTVAAGHLSLYGYDRATSTTLVELAERGIRFDSARAASSWTLPSHATMFTGRWLHELSVGWVTPLDRDASTLAEFLGRGDTRRLDSWPIPVIVRADSGLDRGFTQYRDYIFPELTALKTAVLVSRALDGLQHDRLSSGRVAGDPPGCSPMSDRLLRSLDTDRKGAAVVNRELLDWLSQRPQPERPFFAFLNYNDAHYPYQLPPGRPHRFGGRADRKRSAPLDRAVVGARQDDVSRPRAWRLPPPAYDDCIADLDEQLGKLIDQLSERGELWSEPG